MSQSCIFGYAWQRYLIIKLSKNKFCLTPSCRELIFPIQSVTIHIFGRVKTIEKEQQERLKEMRVCKYWVQQNNFLCNSSHLSIPLQILTHYCWPPVLVRRGCSCTGRLCWGASCHGHTPLVCSGRHQSPALSKQT